MIYRGSGVLNFAQGAIGMVGAYLYWEMKVEHGLPSVGRLDHRRRARARSSAPLPTC